MNEIEYLIYILSVIICMAFGHWLARASEPEKKSRDKLFEETQIAKYHPLNDINITFDPQQEPYAALMQRIIKEIIALRVFTGLDKREAEVAKVVNDVAKKMLKDIEDKE